MPDPDHLGAAMDGLHACAHATATIKGELLRGRITKQGAARQLKKVVERMQAAELSLYAAQRELGADARAVVS